MPTARRTGRGVLTRRRWRLAWRSATTLWRPRGRPSASLRRRCATGCAGSARAPVRSTSWASWRRSAERLAAFDIIGSTMKFLRMKPGHGEVLIAEGDVDVAEDEERLVEEFRRQLDQGLWAAVPSRTPAGRRQAQMVKAFDEIPRNAERVIFFPRAAGGA